MTKFGNPTSVTNLIRSKTAKVKSNRKAFPIMSMRPKEWAKLKIIEKEKKERLVLRAIVYAASNKDWLETELELLNGSFLMYCNSHLKLNSLNVGDLLNVHVTRVNPELTVDFRDPTWS